MSTHDTYSPPKPNHESEELTETRGIYGRFVSSVSGLARELYNIVTEFRIPGSDTVSGDGLGSLGRDGHSPTSRELPSVIIFHILCLAMF